MGSWIGTQNRNRTIVEEQIKFKKRHRRGNRIMPMQLPGFNHRTVFVQDVHVMKSWVKGKQELAVVLVLI